MANIISKGQITKIPIFASTECMCLLPSTRKTYLSKLPVKYTKGLGNQYHSQML